MNTSAGGPEAAHEGDVKQAGDAPPPAESSSRCRCGYAKGHVMISAVGEYSFTGWFMLLFGISALPRLVRYECRQCSMTVSEVSDPDEIRGIRLL